MAAVDGHGRTVRQRQEARQRIIDAAVKNAQRNGRTVTCYTYEVHENCRGESSGGAGCLCECHDPVAEVLQ